MFKPLLESISFLRMLKILIMILAFTYVTACASKSGHTAKQIDDPALEVAMQKFVKALHNKDINAFAALFSKNNNWNYVGTIITPVLTSEHTYAALIVDLRQKTGLYESLFDSGGDDTFRDYISMTDGKPWIRTGDHQFSPPDLPDIHESVYVKWRYEGQRWVVDVIAEPAS